MIFLPATSISGISCWGGETMTFSEGLSMVTSSLKMSWKRVFADFRFLPFSMPEATDCGGVMPTMRGGVSS